MLRIVQLLFSLFSAFLLLVTFSLQANDVRIVDSLIKVLDETNKDSIQYNLCKQIAHEYVQIDIDSAVIYSDKTIAIAEEMNNYKLLTESNIYLGSLFLNEGNYHRAISYYFKALEYAEKNTGDIIDLIRINFNIALVYKSLMDNERSREYNMNALDYWNKAYEKDTNVINIIPLGRIYNNIGVTYHVDNENEKALDYFYKALKVSEETKNNQAIPFAYNNIGLIYQELKDYDIAISFFEKALVYRKEIEDYRGIGLIYSYLALTYRQMGDQEKAIKYFNLAYEMAIEYKYIDLHLEVSEILIEYYAELGNYKKSYEMHLDFKEVHRQLDLIESSKNAAMFDMQYKFDSFQQEMMLEQQRKNYITLMFFIVLITLLLLFTLLYYLTKSKVSRIRLQREKLFLEKENLKSKLDYRNKELTTNVMYLVRKNELISDISERLLTLKGDLTKVNQKPIQDIIGELQRSVDDDVWQEFEYRFKEVHEGFYNTLNEKYPDLSPNEKKLCAFLRLNMSTKEISAITFQSTHSITIARSRLRKKLNINNTDVNLVDFLMDL